jgi:hypothetical protein
MEVCSCPAAVLHSMPDVTGKVQLPSYCLLDHVFPASPRHHLGLSPKGHPLPPPMPLPRKHDVPHVSPMPQVTSSYLLDVERGLEELRELVPRQPQPGAQHKTRQHHTQVGSAGAPKIRAAGLTSTLMVAFVWRLCMLSTLYAGQPQAWGSDLLLPWAECQHGVRVCYWQCYKCNPMCETCP